MTGGHRQIGPSTLEPRIVLSRDAERRDFQAAFNSDLPSASEKPGVLGGAAGCRQGAQGSLLVSRCVDIVMQSSAAGRYSTDKPGVTTVLRRIISELPVIRSEVRGFPLPCPSTSSQSYSIAPLGFGGVVPPLSAGDIGAT
jgi:hypothetical protein